MRVARGVEAGVVLVNNYFRGVLGTSFGGVKDSGHGREHWIGTLREWSQIKNIRYPSGMGAPLPQWRPFLAFSSRILDKLSSYERCASA